eukprot:TRINITY_DN69529_c0_g1_i1.p1 TRINITY_DN69529_c0_g1~~TRINITY_DN69529_c0_g1_i1.p1  ORF type:complete len:232 (-),score=26.31 TRINITY_DN69529_c0_g1_i1:141-836(-)
MASDKEPLVESPADESSSCCSRVLSFFGCCCCISTHPTATVDRWLYSSKLSGQPSEIPPKLQGVFYMDGNPAPEDCYSLNGAAWDASNMEQPILTVQDFRPFTLTYPASCAGFGLYCFQSFCCCATLKFLWDKDVTRARIDPYLCGGCCGPFTCIGRWDMVLDPTTDPDAPEGGAIWKRISLDPKTGQPFPDGQGSYTLRKIVSKTGQRVKSNFDIYVQKAAKEQLVRSSC